MGEQMDSVHVYDTWVKGKNGKLHFDVMTTSQKKALTLAKQYLVGIGEPQAEITLWEGKIKVKDDRDIKWISLRATPRQSNQGGILWDGIVLNITQNKLAEIELANSHAQLAELSSYLQKIKEHERMRTAREIHDDIGGTLTAIKCELQPCIDMDKPRLPEFYQQKARSIEELVDYVIDSTRRISLDLRPGVLDVGIVASVHWQAREFSKRNHIPCEVLCESEDISLNDDLAVAIFRIFQETLTNISKHANASIVKIRLAEMFFKLLVSAVANAEDKGDVNVDNLVVSKVTVDQGPTLKRWRPRAMGRANRILKKTSHITLEVAEARS